MTEFLTPPAWTEDRTLSEAERIERLLDELSTSGWTVLQREVSGRHPHGNRNRLDVVLEVPQRDQWHGGSCVWGLEAKALLPEDATDHAALIVQAVDYRYTEWDGYGFLPLMIWPEPFAAFYSEAGVAVSRAILSKLNVLPLRWVPYHGWWFGKNLTRMWSQERGPTSHAGRWDMRPKWGSQGR